MVAEGSHRGSSSNAVAETEKTAELERLNSLTGAP